MRRRPNVARLPRRVPTRNPDGPRRPGEPLTDISKGIGPSSHDTGAATWPLMDECLAKGVLLRRFRAVPFGEPRPYRSRPRIGSSAQVGHWMKSVENWKSQQARTGSAPYASSNTLYMHGRTNSCSASFQFMGTERWAIACCWSRRRSRGQRRNRCSTCWEHRGRRALGDMSLQPRNSAGTCELLARPAGGDRARWRAAGPIAIEISGSGRPVYAHRACPRYRPLAATVSAT